MSLIRRTMFLRRSMNFVALSHQPEFKQGKTTFNWKPLADTTPAAQGSCSTSSTLTSSSSMVPVPQVQSNWARERLSLLGMPRGYPHTCARGFRRYFYLSVGAAFVGNFGTSIATQTLLGGFFAEASPRVWMLKDLAPAIFAAVIANKVISYEGRPKFWLVVYALLTNVSTITDMYIPSMVPPKYLLAAAVVTSMVKQSALLMFFVTRAACLQHFATHNNLAEFTKKFNSFGMVNFTVAMALGIGYTTLVTNFHAQLATVIVCCAANTTLNYMSVSRIAFRVLNPTTAHVVCRRFIASEGAVVMSPTDVSKVLGMWGTIIHDTARDMTDVMNISPPLSSLRVRAETLGQELIAHPSLPFAFGVWSQNPYDEESSIVARIPIIGKLFVSAGKNISRAWRGIHKAVTGVDDSKGTLAARRLGQDVRLSVLVGADCSNKHLMCACLVAYAALVELETAVASGTTTIPQSKDELSTFLRKCCREHKDWSQKAELLLSRLKELGWETDSLSIDPAELRFSMEHPVQPLTTEGDDAEVISPSACVDDDHVVATVVPHIEQQTTSTAAGKSNGSAPPR